MPISSKVAKYTCKLFVDDSEANVSGTKVLNMTSSSMSDVDTQMIQVVVVR